MREGERIPATSMAQRGFLARLRSLMPRSCTLNVSVLDAPVTGSTQNSWNPFIAMATAAVGGNGHLAQLLRVPCPTNLDRLGRVRKLINNNMLLLGRVDTLT